ncbi:hypothetical protein HDU67_005794 [Dinochytrium kinnereticum]|nr:hypothetical protein HDU67_005794 [Dinochytrium kinnereticum]
MSADETVGDAMAVDTSPSPIYAAHYSTKDLDTAIRVLSVYVDDPDLKSHAANDPQVRQLFSLSRLLLDMSPEELKGRRKKRAKEKLVQDHQTLQATGIRELRKVRMVGMAGGSVGLPLPPLVGSLDANESFMIEDDKRAAENVPTAPTGLAIEAPPNTTSTTTTTTTTSQQQDQQQDQQPSSSIPSQDTKQESEETPKPRVLNYKRSCHICTTAYDTLHSFYDQLCPKCAEYNYAMRFSAANMDRRVCIVTGARVKIGYAIALKLLKMGATVIVTTRFPHDAARRYAEEPDAHIYAGRLHVYGLDFRDMQMLHHFTAHVRLTFGRLDVLINNAAQTVRKPPAFYEHLIAHETGPLPEAVAAIATVVDVYRASGGRYVFGKSQKGGVAAGAIEGADANPDQLHVVEEIHPHGASGEEIVLSTIGAQAFSGGTMVSSSATTALLGEKTSTFLPSVAANVSASMSQLPIIETDHMEGSEAKALFPPGLYDRDDQQVDLRTTNSWKLELGQISTLEMVECHVINSFAPWILVSELKGLMAETGEPGKKDGDVKDWDKYIVNVSAMEGQFYRNKTIFHPHTNMAKASLNMMTRTAAAGFAATSIFMTAVDTGWITDENPVHLWDKRANQPPPLDEWDAAMRVLDPVLRGVRGEERLWGVFLKNYRPTRW